MKLPALLLVAAAVLLSGSASAGPNAGGTLIAHDAGLVYTTDSTSYPIAPPSIDPPGVDNQLPAGVPSDAAGWVWKVYAAFAGGSIPVEPTSWGRIKALYHR